MRSQRGASPHWHAALSASARPHVMLTAAWSSQYLESVTVVLLLLLFVSGSILGLDVVTHLLP